MIKFHSGPAGSTRSDSDHAVLKPAYQNTRMNGTIHINLVFFKVNAVENDD